MTPKDQGIEKIEIDAIWTSDSNPRLVQVWKDRRGNWDRCEEWCVHGIKLRWSCDECEDLNEER